MNIEGKGRKVIKRQIINAICRYINILYCRAWQGLPAGLLRYLMILFGIRYSLADTDGQKKAFLKRKAVRLLAI
jgi:hypothetical protein